MVCGFHRSEMPRVQEARPDFQRSAAVDQGRGELWGDGLLCQDELIALQRVQGDGATTAEILPSGQ